MGNKIQRIYIGTNQVRPTTPPDITEVYTQHSANSTYDVHKDGYKMKSVIIEWQGNYSRSSDWWITDPRLYGDNDTAFSCVCSVGGSYGYNYGDGQGRYGGIRLRYGGSRYGLVSIGSTTTTKNRNAGRILLNTDGFEYSLGKEFGTWLQSGTYTFNAAQKQQIENIFTSAAQSYQTACWNNNTDTFSSITLTITYEPV